MLKYKNILASGYLQIHRQARRAATGSASARGDISCGSRSDHVHTWRAGTVTKKISIIFIIMINDCSLIHTSVMSIICFCAVTLKSLIACIIASMLSYKIL